MKFSLKRGFSKTLTKTLAPVYLMSLTAVAFLIWTVGYRSFVCTNSVSVRLNEVQRTEQGHIVQRAITLFREQGARHGCCSDFYTGINATDTRGKHMFRSNSPLEDAKLILNSAYFKLRPEIVNPLMKNYLIEPSSDLCTGPEGAPYVLVMIPSVSNHSTTRETIRKTWGSVVHTPWPSTNNLPRLKIVFVFGKTSLKEEQIILETENQAHGDILYVDFVDSYRNLTYKSLTSLYWASTRCAEAKFFMKVDEDTFLNVPYLMEYLHYHERDLNRTVIGYAITKPVSVRIGKWAVDFDSYPLPIFPRYVYGHSYVITGDVIQDMVSHSEYLPFIPVEDAVVTGVLAYSVNATRLHNALFAMAAKRPYTCAVVRNVKITVTRITSSSHQKMWEAVQTGKCSYTYFPLERRKVAVHHSKNKTRNVYAFGRLSH